MTDNISEWREACDAMRMQDLGALSPIERGCFAFCAQTYRDAMRAPWPHAQATEAAELADEFDWLLNAAVTYSAAQEDLP